MTKRGSGYVLNFAYMSLALKNFIKQREKQQEKKHVLMNSSQASKFYDFKVSSKFVLTNFINIV